MYGLNLFGKNEEMGPIAFDAALSVSTISEDEDDTFMIRIAIKGPLGNEIELMACEMGKRGDRKVIYQNMPFKLRVENPGMYLVKVYSDAELIGVSPFWLRYTQDPSHGGQSQEPEFIC